MTDREKSVQYPSVSWNTCMDFLKLIDSFKLRSVAYSEVAKKLGLASLTTKSFTNKVSTARQYGLITTSNSTIQITDIGKQILYPVSDNSLSLAQSCFSTPPLYSKLIDMYDGKAVPSETILANLLMRDYKITKAAKDSAAKCFIQTASELELIKGGILCYQESIANSTVDADNFEQKISSGIEPEAIVSAKIEPVHTPVYSENDYITQTIPTSSGKVAKIIIPIDAEEDDLYMIKDMLDIVLKRKFKLTDI